MNEFFQKPPQLGNQYTEDHVLNTYLQWKLPPRILQELESEFERMGHRVVTDIYHLGKAAEATPPRHIPYDAWGKRIDRIELADAWKELDRISATEQLVAIGYARKHGEFSRIHQFVKLYRFHPSSAIYTCPLAMTDGAARALELYGNETLKKMRLYI